MDPLEKQEISSNYASVENNSIVPMEEISTDYTGVDDHSMTSMRGICNGLCVNCDLTNSCMMQEEEKVFCEHYQ
jgi:hypothetical protein